MHDPRLAYIHMRKDLLLQCMHEAAAQHGTPSISPISLQSKTKLGINFVEQLWYGRSWPLSQSERGKSNLEWKKNTFIPSNYNELVDILSSGMETSWHLESWTPEPGGTYWYRRVRTYLSTSWGLFEQTGTYQSVLTQVIPLTVAVRTCLYRYVLLNEKIWGWLKEIIHLLIPQIGVNLVAHVQRIVNCLKC